MTHDYKRHGTTTLFAAQGVLTGTVIGHNAARHRHQEFPRFLNQIEREVPHDKAIHAILNNYCTQKHANVREWLARHPRWTFHFIPTSSSRLNAVEGFFAKLTRRRLKRNRPLHRIAQRSRCQALQMACKPGRNHCCQKSGVPIVGINPQDHQQENCTQAGGNQGGHP